MPTKVRYSNTHSGPQNVVGHDNRKRYGQNIEFLENFLR